MPGSPKHWCVEDAQAWVDDNVRHPGEKVPRSLQTKGRPVEVDPELTGPVSPALEQFRKHRAAMALLDLKERRGSLLPKDKVHTLLVQLAALIRGTGEALQRQFGPDAALLLEEALNEADAYIDRFIDDARSDRAEA